MSATARGASRATWTVRMEVRAGTKVERQEERRDPAPVWSPSPDCPCSIFVSTFPAQAPPASFRAPHVTPAVVASAASVSPLPLARHALPHGRCAHPARSHGHTLPSHSPPLPYLDISPIDGRRGVRAHRCQEPRRRPRRGSTRRRRRPVRATRCPEVHPRRV